MNDVLKNRGFSRAETARILGVKKTQLEWWTKNLDPLPTRTKYSVDVGFSYFILNLLVNHHEISVKKLQKNKMKFIKVFHICASESATSLISKTLMYSHSIKDIDVVDTSESLKYNSGTRLKFDLGEQQRRVELM